jgi:siroheme synthase-like protein
VGGGKVAARKTQVLLDFGALVTALDPDPCESMRTLSQKGALTLRFRAYSGPGDLQVAALVIAATDRGELNRAVAQDARNGGILVNVVDDPEGCTFFFPALVRRGELVAGISTSGSCPRFSARLREQLDAILPPNLGAALELLRSERSRVPGVERIERLDSVITPLLAEIFSPLYR